MNHLLEILKIIEGAVNADRLKVQSYAEQLAVKIEAEGEKQTADRIRRVLANSKMQQLSPAKVGPPSSRLPVDNESRLDLANEEVFMLDQVRIFLELDMQERIDEFIKYIQASDKLITNGINISPSLLLHGPPGCGKTELAHFIAARLELPLITARLDSMISSYLGSTAKNLRYLFDHASARPCILFLDEFDALAKLRDDQHELGELKRVVVSLLQNIDRLENKTVLIAATNHAQLLDPAVWRRFAYKIEMGLPSAPVREQLFAHVLASHASSRQAALFAAASDGLSGGDIRHVAEDSLRQSILDGLQTVQTTSVLKKILMYSGTLQPNGKNGEEQIVRIRNMNPKVFTYRRLAEIFGRSLGTISNLIAKGQPDHAAGNQTPYQGRDDSGH